jgi:ribonuclease HI
MKHSVHFLLNYAISLHANLCTTSKNMPLDSKGKKPMWNHLPHTCKETKKNKTDLQKWKPPDQGWLKVNVDGSYIAETGQASIGVVIRDHTGQAVLAAGKNFQNCCDAQESEALAAKEGARLAAQWCNKPVIFESDCTTITHAIQSKEQHLSQLKSILHDFNLYASNLIQWSCMYAKRNQNNVAHVIARYTMSTGLDFCWNRNFSDCVEEAIATDCKLTVPHDE